MNSLKDCLFSSVSQRWRPFSQTHSPTPLLFCTVCSLQQHSWDWIGQTNELPRPNVPGLSNRDQLSHQVLLIIVLLPTPQSFGCYVQGWEKKARGCNFLLYVLGIALNLCANDFDKLRCFLLLRLDKQFSPVRFCKETVLLWSFL